MKKRLEHGDKRSLPHNNNVIHSDREQTLSFFYGVGNVELALSERDTTASSSMRAEEAVKPDKRG